MSSEPPGDRSAGASERPFIRWQGRALAQLTYTANLVLAFSVATLGYAANLLREPQFPPPGIVRCAFLGAVVFLLLAIAAGLSCALNRVRDFRATARVARQTELGTPSSNRDALRRAGDLSWNLFYGECVFFGLGILALIVALGTAYKDKLF